MTRGGSGLRVVAATLLAVVIVGSGCGPAAPSDVGGPAAGSAPSARSAPKRIAFAVAREQDLRPTGTGPQRNVHPLVHQGLTGRAVGRQRAARLAEEVASLENGH